MKYLLTRKEVDKDLIGKFPLGMTERTIGDFKIFTEDKNNIVERESFAGIAEGYIRNLNLTKNSIEEHTASSFEYIIKKWPLPENITGSFTCFIINKVNEELILCNDLIGLYPVYYLKREDDIIISNSIILIGLISGEEFDEAGILQRSIGQDFSNIGTRTILKNCKRLLPGEFLKMDSMGNKLDVLYDNSLFQNISSSNQIHQTQTAYWTALKKEVNACLTDKQEIKVALSGGIDSRIVLGAIPQNKNIECLTFGEKNNYETIVAAKLAKIKKAAFNFFYQPELYFPPYEVLRKYTLETEAVQICSWLEIMENVQTQPDIPILLGELCEALPGRNIKKYSTRKFREKNFFKYYLLNKDYIFEPATPANFQEWKDRIFAQYKIWYGDIRKDTIDIDISSEKMLAALKEDLEELFLRIEAHNLPYAELYDELFSWYTYTRMRLAKQLLISNTRFSAYSPAMSMQVLRNTSNIHPNLRLNYRFVKKLFKDIPELKKFSKIPTSQAPLIPQYFPDLIKFPIWGLRSKVDSFLIKKMMRRKNLNARYRLFKSIDWAGAYQLPEMERNMDSYFKKNHLGEVFYENIRNQCVERKKMNQWPFANIDIINAAALNLEIELIKSLRVQDEF